MRVDISRSQTEYWVTCSSRTMMEFEPPSPQATSLGG
jgi:hypothetical protein